MLTVNQEIVVNHSLRSALANIITAIEKRPVHEWPHSQLNSAKMVFDKLSKPINTLQLLSIMEDLIKSAKMELVMREEAKRAMAEISK